MSITDQRNEIKSPMTGDQLYQRELAKAKEALGEDIPESHREFIRSETYNPAVLLTFDTSACPSWCDRNHDVAGPAVYLVDGRNYLSHNGPELCRRSYDGSPRPAAPGRSARLVAYEHVDSPGQLHYLVGMQGQEDGIHAGYAEWNFDLPADWLHALAASA